MKMEQTECSETSAYKLYRIIILIIVMFMYIQYDCIYDDDNHPDHHDRWW